MTFTRSSTGTIAAGAADTGFFETTITASDGTYSGTHTLYWFVAADPPDLTVSQDLTVKSGTPITLQASATDPDGIASVEWWFSFYGEDWELDPELTSLTVTYTFTTYGEYDVFVIVTDNNGDVSEDSFHVIVTESTPTANLVTASGPIIRGGTVTFTAAVIDPDALDTVSLYVDWQGTGTFDQLDQAQLEFNPDGSFNFAHVYPEAGNFTAVLRIADDNGEDTDYPVNVVVQGVMPSVTLTTTSDYSWVPSGSEITTWALGAEGLVQFTDITPAGTLGLEYHFFLTEEGTGAETEVVRETPTLALPDYTAGKRYQVRGYVKDKFSDNQSPEQTLNVIVGDPRNGLWGTFAVDGAPPGGRRRQPHLHRVIRYAHDRPLHHRPGQPGRLAI